MERNEPEQKKIETIIYGGAFNPPTLAHVAILNACAGYARTSDAESQKEIWVMPSGDRSDKTIGVETDRRLRYVEAMIADADAGDIRILPVTTELERTCAIETYDTVMELEQSHPDRSFTWVFGADSTETMAEWKQGDWLLENLRMLAVERVGSSVNPLAKRALALTVPSLAVSSTMVRQRMTNGDSLDDLVSPHVLALLA
jgi:nicotinate-nucleotide adenylyltransferase